MRETNETTYISELNTPLVVLVGVLAIMFSIIIGTLVFWRGVKDTSAAIGIAAFLSLFFSGGATLLAMAAVGRPRIVLDFFGIRREGVFSTENWRWRDVGVFSVGAEFTPPFPRYYLCAFTDVNHDLMVSQGEEPKPTVGNADIKIFLGATDAGWSRENAEDLAAKANAWRDRFGAPEIEVDAANASAKYYLLKGMLEGRSRRYALMIVGAGILAAVLAVVKRYQRRDRWNRRYERR